MFAEHGGLRRPVIRVGWRTDDQVVVDLRTRPGDHVTLHRREGEPTLLTLWMKDKPPSVHDARRVDAARAAAYVNPEKHANYVSQQEVKPIVDVEGFPLVGWLVDIAAASHKAKYEREPYVELEAPSDPFRLSVHLSVPESPITTTSEPHIATLLGHLYFRGEPI